MNLKNILAVVLSLIAAYFVLKVLWWLLSAAFTIALGVLQIVVLLVIAVPLYALIRSKLLR